MAELQQNRYDKLIRRVGGIIGPGSMVAEAITELFPMIDVERVPGELLALMGTRTAFASGDTQAVAGVKPQLQLFNPANSETIMTVTTVIITTAITQRVTWNINNVAFTNLLTRGLLRDTRFHVPAGNLGIAQIREQTVAVPVPASGHMLPLANTPTILQDENGIAVLSPGFGFDVGGSTDASRILTTFYWRERPLESSEVNLGG